MEAKKEEEVKTRIYVGGLGEKVTADDLTKIFSPLGEVKAVDIVRTKGRSFGYVDFFPSSHKSLNKLLSTYNRCVWKGGRLRLEKAKEHYLARLKREWEEDAQLVSTSAIESVDIDKGMDTLEKQKTAHNSEKNINIFFPRLRKVKPLPIRGTGKHKYSFQRVEVPSVPKYFCDCEEHSVPSHTAEGKQIYSHNEAEEEICDLEAQSGAMNEEELNMMNSVMNKLFERENVSSAARHETGLETDGNNSVQLVDDLQFGASDADNVADEDNLIINVVSKGNRRMAEKPTMSLINQKLPSSEIHTSKGGPVQRVPKVQKNNNLSPNKKRKSPLNEESIRNEFVSANPGSDVNMQPHKNELKTRWGAQPAGTKSGVKQSATNHSWSQKMSWKALVGNKDSSLFNVSNILPVVASAKEGDSVVEPVEDLLADENETDDNLIINVVSKKNNKMAVSRDQEKELNSTMIQKSTFNGTQTSEDKPDESVVRAKKKSTLSPKKKRKLLRNEESDRSELVPTTTEDNGSLQTHTKESWNPLGAQPIEPESGGKQSIANHSESQKSSGRALVGDKDKDSFSVSDILADISAEEEQPVSDGPNIWNLTDDKKHSLAKYENLKGKSDEAEIVDVHEGQPTNAKEASNKSGRGPSWFQKSPWTKLVTENENSFSITQISPASTFKKHVVTKPLGVINIENPADSNRSDLAKQDKGKPTGSGYKVEEKEGDFQLNFPDEKQQIVLGSNNESSTSVAENKYNSGQQQATTGDVSIGETCSFMRSADSLKEWAHTKAALSGPHKRKSSEK